MLTQNVLLYNIFCVALLFGAENPSLDAARSALLASRYQQAIDLYTPHTANDSIAPAAYLGLVQAHLNLHHSREAYAAADAALKLSPNNADALTAAGLADFRRGDLPKAEQDYFAALKLQPNHPIALDGLADVYSTISLFKKARDLRLKAHQAAPDDLSLASAYINTLEPEDRIAELEEQLALIDPTSEDANHLRVRIAIAKALGRRKLRVLTSTYEPSKIKMERVSNGPGRPVYGVGLNVRFNNNKTLKLLLDTGASGIAISPKAAQVAGMENLTTLTDEAKGIGDGKVSANSHYLASEVRIGSVAFSNFPISAFRSAKNSNVDGLIGADVFQRFLVTLDFEKMEVDLEPRAVDPATETGPFDRKPQTAPGFYRVFRFGNHLAIPTIVNEGKPVFFLVDTGAANNFIDVGTARSHSTVKGSYDTEVRGVQGKVAKVFEAREITLTFAGFRQRNNDLLAINLEKMSDDMGSAFGGIIGIPALSALRITIDYREGAVKLELRKDLKF